jgi:3-mercaptopyruvate sulfurtransferase SseA
MTSDPQADEAHMKDQVKALQELEDRSQAETRKAYEAIDQVLDVRQQARFRVFEEQMEQRMLQLITRARQANRPKL